jgi:GGDEF domain-containing protein
LLMIDVDHFQSFDERYGGPGGEACLQSVAQALKGVSRRPADLVARYGSDAFVVLLPQTPRGGAEHVAHEVLAAVAAVGSGQDASSMVRSVTASVGVGCYAEASDGFVPPESDSRHDAQSQALCSAIDLVRAAQDALSSAKSAGGNQARLLDVVDAAASPAH